MCSKKNNVALGLVAAILLISLLAGCGSETPTDAPPSTEALPAPATEPATDTTFESAFDSPLPEPVASPPVGQVEPGASPSPTGTPDPGITPVAILLAQIEPDLEVVTVGNISMVDQDISRWSIFNLEAEPVFRFPENTVLKPGETVQVYSAIPESEVPEGSFFWTEDKVWLKFPADVLLLNQGTRLVYWYVAYGNE